VQQAARDRVTRPLPAAPARRCRSRRRPCRRRRIRSRAARVAQADPVSCRAHRRARPRVPGTVGIAVRDVHEGWVASHNGRALMPQQSVSKLWVAIALMDAVDRDACG
jgi:beta-lactamase class A